MIPDVASDYVSIIWEGFLLVPTSDDYIFSLHANDGVNLYVDQSLVISNMTIVDNELSGHRLVSESVTL